MGEAKATATRDKRTTAENCMFAVVYIDSGDKRMEVVRRQMLTSSVYEKKVDLERRTKGYLFREESDWRCRNLDFEGGKAICTRQGRDSVSRAMAVLVCWEEIWVNPLHPPSFLGQCHLKMEPRM